MIGQKNGILEDLEDGLRSFKSLRVSFKADKDHVPRFFFVLVLLKKKLFRKRSRKTSTLDEIFATDIQDVSKTKRARYNELADEKVFFCC